VTRPEHPPRTPLSGLAAWLGERSPEVAAAGNLDVVVTGCTLSSQRVHPGDLYVALSGARAHGIDYADLAVSAGAVAILTDPEGAARAPAGVPLLVIDRPRAVLGRLAAEVYGNPAASMRMIGVTGTQGKTTTTRLTEGGLQAAGVPAGVIGTVGTRIAGADVASVLTTPEAPELHALFAVMREQGVEVCAMEVSSHALVMGRVDGVVFDAAVFLNLGRDHLDFHPTVEDYYLAKASLFTPERCRRALVSVDDDHGRRLAGELAGKLAGQPGVPVHTFSGRADRPGAADWTVADVVASPERSSFRILGPGLDLAAGVPLPGDFNVDNALAAVASVAEAGLDARTVERVAAAVAAGSGVPGRFERVEGAAGFTVVVDYAHKPDAVEAALRTLRPLSEGRVIIVLGAGGDRDAGKRPLLGEVAARLADVLVVTDDNPRSEDPAAIRAAVLDGARSGTGRAEVVEVGDRKAAIAEALRRARPGDIVLVAGTGHETGQEVGGVVHPFDDRAVVRELLQPT
jgi:UDP-N-acetylmuramoyl-L-alanyl-D-glutamate--2,6-diaminopimelate ligase